MAGDALNKSAMLLAIGGKPKGSSARGPMASAPEPDSDDAAPAGDELKRSAAEDAMAAFQEGDVGKLSDALSDFVRACKSEDY